jgi:hypothetical protein
MLANGKSRSEPVGANHCQSLSLKEKASTRSMVVEDTFYFGRGKFFAHNFQLGLSLDPKTPAILAEELAKSLYKRL